MTRRLVVSIECDNAAFEDLSHECARILRAVAEKLKAGREEGKIMDANGNSVGRFEIVDEA